MVTLRLNNSDKRAMKKIIPDDLRVVVPTVTILRPMHLQQIFTDNTQKEKTFVSTKLSTKILANMIFFQ